MPGIAANDNAFVRPDQFNREANTEPARLGVMAGCDPYTHSSDPFNRLNSSCFFAQSPGSIGLESGIDYLHGPGLWNFDLSIQKQFSIKEKARLQFRIDAFNAFNHAAPQPAHLPP